ncbi:MAG: DUF4351 domain-containing protein [Armatimonadota bacterium]|nr:DUF4351 domain-containing protein [Armatimonadota bacterium]
MIEGVPWISDWIAEGEARGKATGEATGEARGKAAEAQQIALRLMRKRFGALSPEVVAQVEGADTARCEDIAERLLEARTLTDLGLS